MVTKILRCFERHNDYRKLQSNETLDGMQPEKKKDRLHRSTRTQVLNLARKVFMLPPLEKALSRLTRGRPVESRIGKLPANCYQYPKPSWRSVVRAGIAYELDIADMVDWAVYFGYSQAAKQRLFSMAHPGDTVIDVGTNIGEMLLTFAKSVTPTGQVFGFEPDPANHAKCLRNISLNPFTHVTLEALALGRGDATLNLVCVDEHNRGMNHLVQNEDSGTRVRVLPLDQYVAEKRIERIDLIKIDVEGFELSVLEGARQSIERYRPRLFIEICDEFLRGNGSSAAQLIKWVLQYPYSITNAASGAPIDASTDLTGCAIDIVCLPH